MRLQGFLESTYLKTSPQANLSEEENRAFVTKLVDEAIKEGFKLIMIRPVYISKIRERIDRATSGLLLGTVIDFPKGTSSIDQKLREAKLAIRNGADELDFVINYESFKAGDTQKVKNEVQIGTTEILAKAKTIKWIIEAAALSPLQIKDLSELIKETVLEVAFIPDISRVFIKSSTGFYKTTDGSPNGATIERIKIMLQHGYPLPIKAAGGIRSYRQAHELIQLGVKRIGTSSALQIVRQEKGEAEY